MSQLMPKNLTDSQQGGWEVLQKRKVNSFLTGHAGTGKTFLLKKWLGKQYSQSTRIMASTGMAAVNIEGRTFHSFFGIGIAKGDDQRIVHKVVQNGKVFDTIQQTRTIVIDEISMLSGRLLNIANAICQAIKCNPEPWGGIKVITCGDFGQLPPIPDDGSRVIDWGFNSKTWEQSEFENIFLDQPVRTEDIEFLKILDRVRIANTTPDVEKFLKDHEISQWDADGFEGTRIFSTRAKVDVYNQQKLDELEGKEVVFETVYKGDGRYFERLKNSLVIPDILTLKKDALVMIRVNSTDLEYINGTLAKVVSVDPKNALLELENLVTGVPIHLARHDFEWKNEYDQTVATARNFPVSLAWACTIHKSQGASISRLMVDMGWLWEYGQAYVALSRSSDPNNLRILNPRTDGIKAAPEVIDFYKKLMGEC